LQSLRFYRLTAGLSERIPTEISKDQYNKLYSLIGRSSKE
jgi:hypothetical protein